MKGLLFQLINNSLWKREAQDAKIVLVFYFSIVLFKLLLISTQIMCDSQSEV